MQTTQQVSFIPSRIKPAENPCPLCVSSEATVIAEIPYHEIWSHLNSEWDASFSDPVKASHTPTEFVKLKICQNCKLQYFAPAISGSGNFYSELTSSCSYYYSDHKWEFDYAKEFISNGQKVLDVACGKGAFLCSIKELTSFAVGVDTNPDAVSFGKDQNIPIYNQSIEAFSAEHGEEFDFVSAFQVIEHLDTIMPFVSSAYKCVKPGGLLVLSVPNCARRKDAGFDSLDFPPHHISRWSEDQLAKIAELLEAELVSVAREPLNKSQMIGALRLKELPELLPSHFAGRQFAIKAVSRLMLTFPMSMIWQWMDMPQRMGMYGMSMIAVIRKPFVSSRKLS